MTVWFTADPHMGLDIGHFRPGQGRPIPSEKLFVRGDVVRRGIVKKRVLEEELL